MKQIEYLIKTLTMLENGCEKDMQKYKKGWQYDFADGMKRGFQMSREQAEMALAEMEEERSNQ